MVTLKIFFWTALFIVFYTYMGYGILLYLIVYLKRLFKGKPVKAVLPSYSDLPAVTLMICAYNEQDIVKMKMRNTRELDYPKEKLKVMWVTDGSNDSTNELLQAYDEVTIAFKPERMGKTAALNHGISLVDTEIVVMTDANTILNASAIKEIVRAFANPKVACVAGEKRVMARHEGETAAEGEGMYWKYESTLKSLDSELFSTMGAAGELCAIRTSLYEDMPSDTLLDDFIMSMRLVDKGYKTAYVPDAYAMEYGSADMTEESKRKRRIAAGGLQSIARLLPMLNPLHHPIATFQYISHRVLRWSITPFALISLIPLNAALVMLKAGTVYTVIWIFQILFYLAAFCGWYLTNKGHKTKFLSVPYYFLFMNINIFKGISYLKSHRSSGTWEKARRS